MKRLILILVVALMPLWAFAGTPIDDLLGRILPNNGDAAKFKCEVVNDNSGQDYFTVSSNGSNVNVKGPNYVSVAAGINWFLHRAGIDIAWNNPTATLPATLPTIEEQTHKSSVDYRYYLNFCTHSYSMAFWGWDRWQQEIDWMALHGINLPLVITGMECVWRDVLMNGYGYKNLSDVNKFVTGSAYYGWFFMNNMTEWGGPQPESWYTQRAELAKKIFERMKQLGMTPVIPGYVGMVPSGFLNYATKATGWTASDIVNGGTWNNFERPYFVNNTARLKEFAAKYYESIKRVFGESLSTHYYAIDPFHEGGVPKGVTDATASIKAMWDALKTADPEAVWVAQHWQGNPTTQLTHSIPRGKLIILDLHGDSNGETSLGGNSTDANGQAHQWVWGMTSNFGGNVGLFGRMDRVMSSFYAAVKGKSSNNLAGIGAIPEGIENNPMLYDMLYALPWTGDKSYDQDSWLKDYITMRYGVTETSDPTTFNTLFSAWTRLAEGVYNCPSNSQQGTTESVFMMRPDSKPGTVSSWASSSWYWDLEDLRTAAYEFMQVADKLKDNDNYQYDLVDIMRQALADYGKQVLDSIGSTSDATDRKAWENKFLDLILDQDQLTGTRKEFRLGTWTEMARSLGTTEDEKTLYEKNARMLLTTWGAEAQCNGGGLHDYANREWNGLLSSYYYPRWKSFFEHNLQYQNWFTDYEWPFATGATNKANHQYLPANAPYAYGSFSSSPVGDAVETALAMYQKYFSDFKPLTWQLADIDTSKTYLLTNVNGWYNNSAERSEGLCLAAPNTDYSAGYRLQRATLNTTDESYYWKFVSTDTPHAYKLMSVKLQDNATYGSMVSSTPSSTGYPAFTLNKEGSAYYVYQSGDKYYLQDAESGVYMSPDLAWATACVLVSKSRSAASYLHLDEPNGSKFSAATDSTKVYQMVFIRGNAVVGNYGATADASGAVSTSAASRSVTTAIASDDKADAFATTLWKFSPSGWDTYITNVQTGFYVGNVDNNNLVTTAQRQWGRAYRIDSDKSNRWVARDMQVSGENNYLNSFYGSSNPTARNIGYWKDGFSDEGNIFIVREVKEIPVAITKGWKAVTEPVDVQVPEGAEAYVVTATTNSTVQLTRLDDAVVIPAGTGFILHTAADTCRLVVASTPASLATFPVSLLTGVTTARTGLTAGGWYQLALSSEGNPQFSLASKTTVSCNTAIILKTSDGMQSVLDCLLPTGISTVVVCSEDANAPVYSLSGVRMTGKLPAGIYVKNDKKFIKR